MRFIFCGIILASVASCNAFSSFSTRASYVSRASVLPFRMVEKVDVDVVENSEKSEDISTAELMSAATEVFSQIKGSLSNLTVEDIQSDTSAAIEGMKKNIKEGNIGERGELISIIPPLLLLFVLFDDIPLVGGLLEFVAGPGLALAGLALVLSGILGLGKNLSPWTTPSEDNVLITSGAFSLCRHPIYAGLIAFTLGLGFATESFNRIALAALLLYIFDKKATEEEAKLAAVHPAYETYQEEIPKFFPLIDKLNLPKF